MLCSELTKLYQGMPEKSWPVVALVGPRRSVDLVDAALDADGAEVRADAVVVLRRRAAAVPCLQALKISWPNAALAGSSALRKKSLYSFRSNGASVMTFLNSVPTGCRRSGVPSGW